MSKELRYLALADCYLSANDIDLARTHGWVVDYPIPLNDGSISTVYYPSHYNKSECLVKFTLFIIEELGKKPYDVVNYYY